jgi:hypothetical protein
MLIASMSFLAGTFLISGLRALTGGGWEYIIQWASNPLPGSCRGPACEKDSELSLRQNSCCHSGPLGETRQWGLLWAGDRLHAKERLASITKAGTKRSGLSSISRSQRWVSRACRE